MFDDLLEHDIYFGATLVGAGGILQVGTTLIAVFYWDYGHRLAPGLLALILATRIGDGRIILLGLGRRDTGIDTVLLGGTFHENGEDEFDDHEHAAHDGLNFGRNFTSGAQLQEILF